MSQTLEIINTAIKEKRHVSHCAMNAAKLVTALHNKDLLRSIRECDIINADGKAIVWAAKLLGKNFPERVAGIDLMECIVKYAADNRQKIFFFGAKEEVVSKVVSKYSNLYGTGIIAGYRNGYFAEETESQIANSIAQTAADILFVAISSPKKEIFLNKYKAVLNTPFVMGVGGSFDVVAGLVSRAPLWMQSAGLEWFYRFLQEPRRMWKRYLVTNTLFIYLILKEKLRGPKGHVPSTAMGINHQP